MTDALTATLITDKLNALTKRMGGRKRKRASSGKKKKGSKRTKASSRYRNLTLPSGLQFRVLKPNYFKDPADGKIHKTQSWMRKYLPFNPPNLAPGGMFENPAMNDMDTDNSRMDRMYPGWRDLPANAAIAGRA